MAIKKIQSLFYESPTPKKDEVKSVIVEAPKPILKDRISSIINEGVLFGNGPKLFGTGQSQIAQSKGGGGGYAGAITHKKQPGETQFGILDEEGEEEDGGLDAVAAETDAPEGEAPPEDATAEAPAEETPPEGETPVEDAPSEPPTPEAPPEPEKTPDQKVTEMFADTGDVDVDYSLTNENNIRLEKFKFVNAGIDLNTMIPEDDKKSGISTKEIVNLLTPSQRDMLKDKNRELRKKYPLMDKREKYVILHNSNVPIFNTKEGETREISKETKKQAYDKINAYLETNFGKNWQDKSKAIDFLRTIKINFSDTPAIRANLIGLESMMSEEGENYKLPLDKVNVMVPSIVQEFIKDNKEDPSFAKSNIFRTITSAYNQEAGTKGQIYVVLNSENLGDGEGAEGGDATDEAPPEDAEAPPEGEDTGDAGAEAPTGGDEMDGALENAVDELPVG